MITLFSTIKIIHVISACVLFGTGLGTAGYMLLANRSKDISIIAAATGHVVKADWIFTTTSGVVQALTGVALAHLSGFSLLTPWLFWAIIGYCVAGACWLPVVYLQIQLHKIAQSCYQQQVQLPSTYHRYYRYWFILGWPAFIALIIVYYLMVAMPVF